jgi:hypothetical protein
VIIETATELTLVRGRTSGKERWMDKIKEATK